MKTLNQGRGVNPGDTAGTQATLAGVAGPLNQGRGVNPGDTSLFGTTFQIPGPTLNQGRGVNPGDTPAQVHFIVSVGLERSTKAGA